MFKVGFEADTKGLKQADNALDEMAMAADKADNAVEDLNQELVKNTKIAPKVAKTNKKVTTEIKKTASAFKLQKGASQQLGFQLQDMAVQAQMGISVHLRF